MDVRSPRSLTRALAAAACALLLAASTVDVGAAPARPAPPVSGADWLTTLNYYRALAGVPPVREDPALSEGARQHARYMVETGYFAHDQAVPSPFATPAGAAAAANGNLYGTSGVLQGTREAIDAWADSLGHALWMLSPRLTTVGWGQYTAPDERNLRSAAVLDVTTAPQADFPAAPVTLPASGTVVAPAAFPSATENTVAPCPGYPATGLPVFYVFLPEAPAAPVAAMGVIPATGGAPRRVEACAYAADTYRNANGSQDEFRSILDANRAIAIVPREPLLPGATYGVDVVSGPRRVTWTFETTDDPGYWLVTRAGEVVAFGGAAPLGSLTGGPPVVDVQAARGGAGYWVLDETGDVSAFGTARDLGGPAGLGGANRAVSISATPSGNGYWVVTARGQVFGFGDAPFLGDMSRRPLNGPVLDSVSTPSGRGYYMVASDGGVFTFGDARFRGSMGGRRLNAPVRSMVPDGDGDGYWLVAGDGGVFTFAAPFRGSMGGRRLNRPVVGMVRYGNGYLLVAEDGGVFNFGNRPFAGSLGDRPPASPVVAITAF